MTPATWAGVAPAARGGPAARALRAPARRFPHWQAALRAVADHVAGLRDRAAWRRARGLTVTDQDQPDEAFCLVPPRPVHPPLVIVGGMGPLAGAAAFGRACARSRDARAVVLYQACSVPDRSTVILREGRPDTAACREMAATLARAVRRAVDLLPPAAGPARCLVACNSAHYFWALLLDELRRAPARPEVRMVSLVGSSLEALRARSHTRALLLGTEGARVGRVFSAPCRAAGIAFDEPGPALGRLLMRAIFEGMKALDERRAAALGDEFFRAVLRGGRDYDCILVGCTELPLAIDLLRLRGSRAVNALLSRVALVDPLEEALDHA